MNTTNLNAISQATKNRRTVDRFFNHRYRMLLDHSGAFRPALNVPDDIQQHTVELSLPKMEKDNLEISIRHDVMTILGKSQHIRDEASDREVQTIPFTFSLLLPEEIDQSHITATMKDGTLKIVMPASSNQTDDQITSKNITIR